MRRENHIFLRGGEGRGWAIGHIRILGIGLALVCSRGSCGETSLKSDKYHLHLKTLPALASVSS